MTINPIFLVYNADKILNEEFEKIYDKYSGNFNHE